MAEVPTDTHDTNPQKSLVGTPNATERSRQPPYSRLAYQSATLKPSRATGALSTTSSHVRKNSFDSAMNLGSQTNNPNTGYSDPALAFRLPEQSRPHSEQPRPQLSAMISNPNSPSHMLVENMQQQKNDKTTQAKEATSGSVGDHPRHQPQMKLPTRPVPPSIQSHSHSLGASSADSDAKVGLFISLVS